MNSWVRLLILFVAVAGFAQAAPQITVENALWGEEGESVQLTLKFSDLDKPSEVRLWLPIAPQGRAESRGTSVQPASEPQEVSFTLNIPPQNRWRPLEVRVGGIGQQEGQFTLQPPDGDLYVLALGVKTFGGPESGFRNLNVTVNDATALNDLLTSQRGKLYRKVHSYLLTEEKATRQGVTEAMSQISSQAKPNDTVIILLSSHGDVFGGKYYTMLYQGDSRKLDATALAQEELQDFYASLKSKTLLLIDTCTAGAALLSQPKAPINATQTIIAGMNDTVSKSKTVAGSKAYVNEYRVFITAAGPNQESLESASLQHGYFTYAVLEALRGEFEPNAAARANIDPNRPRSEIQTLQLLAYVVERVRDLSRDAPIERQRQVPHYDPISTTFPVVRFNINIDVTLVAGGGPSIQRDQPDVATGIYVSPQGNDLNSGSRTSPLHSLQQALRTDFNRINLLPGDYQLPPGGLTIAKEVTLTASGKATLHCSPTSDGLTIANIVQIQNLNVTDCKGVAILISNGKLEMNGGALYKNNRAALIDGGRVNFKNLSVSENGGGRFTAMVVQNGGSLTLEESTLQNNEFDAIRVQDNSGLTVISSKFRNNSKLVDNGPHIFANGTGAVRISDSSFEGGKYSIASNQKDRAINLCRVTDSTQKGMFQIKDTCTN